MVCSFSCTFSPNSPSASAFGLQLDLGLRFGNALFYRKIHFTLGVGEFALFAHDLRLRLLSLRELGFAFLIELFLLFELLRHILQVERNGRLRFFCFFLGKLFALSA